MRSACSARRANRVRRSRSADPVGQVAGRGFGLLEEAGRRLVVLAGLVELLAGGVGLGRQPGDVVGHGQVGEGGDRGAAASSASAFAAAMTVASSSSRGRASSMRSTSRSSTPTRRSASSRVSSEASASSAT